MNEWIKLTEKKPENGQQCLIFVNDMNDIGYGRYYGVHIGRYILEYDYDYGYDLEMDKMCDFTKMDVTFEGFDSNSINDLDGWGEVDEGTWRNEREYFNKCITHWMPLPEKPKED